MQSQTAKLNDMLFLSHRLACFCFSSFHSIKTQGVSVQQSSFLFFAVQCADPLSLRGTCSHDAGVQLSVSFS